MQSQMLSKKIQKVTVDAIVSECWLDLQMNGAVLVLMSASTAQSCHQVTAVRTFPKKQRKIA